MSRTKSESDPCRGIKMNKRMIGLTELGQHKISFEWKDEETRSIQIIQRTNTNLSFRKERFVKLAEYLWKFFKTDQTLSHILI